MAKRFFRCEKCGNIVGLIKDAGGPLSCCGQPMTELIPNTVDAAAEKHVPVITLDREGGEVTVQVGTVAHPMLPEHFIEWKDPFPLIRDEDFGPAFDAALAEARGNVAAIAANARRETPDRGKAMVGRN